MGIKSESVREELILLAELQQVDVDISAIERELAKVQHHLDKFDNDLSAMAAQVEENATELDALKKQYRNDESEVRSIEDTIKKTQAKLNSVKTNKEYQAMLKSIDDLNAKNSNLQDNILGSLDLIEAAEKKSTSLLADQKDLKEEIEEKKSAVLLAAEEQKEKIGRLQTERQGIWEQLPPKWQNVYGRALKQGKGLGVTVVNQAVCQACRVNLPPQLFIDLMRLKSMILCPNCQRIMYPATIWDVQEKSVKKQEQKEVRSE